jgi:hypothetical protein
MYKGTLIEDLMKTVEDAERRTLEMLSAAEKLEHFYAIAQFELTQFESSLAGVA